MADLIDLLESMEGERRAGALEVLDQLTRPMTAREIEAALRIKGKVPKARATKLAGTLKHFHVIAMLGPEA